MIQPLKRGDSLRVIVLWMLGGCAVVGPDYQTPEPVLPETHGSASAELDRSAPADADPVDLVVWWEAFEDPTLTELVQRAIAGNKDMATAIQRIAEAEAILGVERSAAGPRLDLNGRYRRAGISENTQFGLFPGQSRSSDEYQLGLASSWELDLWGRNQRILEAAGADLESRVEDLGAVHVSVTAMVGDAYLRLRENQRREAIARTTITTLEGNHETSTARFHAGLVQELDMLRAQTELESSRALLPRLQLGAAAAMAELELLCGLEPSKLTALLSPTADTTVAIPVPGMRVGDQVPADLLRRRPDLRSVERQLAAQTARIGVATADLYPTFTLLGNFGLLAEKPQNLFQATSITHSIGPSFSVPLFSGGGVRRNIAAADARAKQALVAYERTLLEALHEVDSAARSIVLEGLSLETLDRAKTSAQASLMKSVALYEQGLTAVDTVLDSRRALYSIEDARAQARSATSRAHVDLYRALGGGWPGAGSAPEDE